MRHLIVVLGYRNDTRAILFEETVSRCERAVELAAADPNALIVATGTFGEFNESDIPHGKIVTTKLIDLGVPREKILPFVRSSRTLEDAFAVRATMIREKMGRLTVVTSLFHLERAKFLFNRICPEFDLEFSCANQRHMPDVERIVVEKDKRQAPKKLNEEKADWMFVPVFGAISGDGQEFPRNPYDNASLEQKTYDQLSYLVLSGIFIIFAAPYSLLKGSGYLTYNAMLSTSIVLILALYVLYIRLAHWAYSARRYLYLIETQWATPGFSYNILHGSPLLKVPNVVNIAVKQRFIRILSVMIGFMILVDLSAIVYISRNPDFLYNEADQHITLRAVNGDLKISNSPHRIAEKTPSQH